MGSFLLVLLYGTILIDMLCQYSLRLILIHIGLHFLYYIILILLWFPPQHTLFLLDYVTTQIFFPLFTLLQQHHLNPWIHITFVYLFSCFLCSSLLLAYFYSMDSLIEKRGVVITFTSYILFLILYALSTAYTTSLFICVWGLFFMIWIFVFSGS